MDGNPYAKIKALGEAIRKLWEDQRIIGWAGITHEGVHLRVGPFNHIVSWPELERARVDILKWRLDELVYRFNCKKEGR